MLNFLINDQWVIVRTSSINVIFGASNGRWCCLVVKEVVEDHNFWGPLSSGGDNTRRFVSSSVQALIDRVIGSCGGVAGIRWN